MTYSMEELTFEEGGRLPLLCEHFFNRFWLHLLSSFVIPSKRMMTFGGESLSSSLGRKRRVAAKGWGGRRIGQVFGQPLAECEIFFGRTRLESPRLINLGTKKRTFAYGLNHLSSNFSVDLHCRPLRVSLFFCTTPHLEAQDHVVLVSTLHCHRLVLTPQTSPSCTTIAPLLERSSHHPRSPCVGEDPLTELDLRRTIVAAPSNLYRWPSITNPLQKQSETTVIFASSIQLEIMNPSQRKLETTVH
uniref:Uncharacterized protein n=1 Tax=Vitis vinifera TaxID=29760 RepID=A5AF88_VITVI|nr:hypothetical protein VITISV_016752 [Vitis vinifera]